MYKKMVQHQKPVKEKNEVI
jgi:alpha-tubulin suppressor-like RCC1 family protein